MLQSDTHFQMFLFNNTVFCILSIGKGQPWLCSPWRRVLWDHSVCSLQSSRHSGRVLLDPVAPTALKSPSLLPSLQASG